VKISPELSPYRAFHYDPLRFAYVTPADPFVSYVVNFQVGADDRAGKFGQCYITVSVEDGTYKNYTLQWPYSYTQAEWTALVGLGSEWLGEAAYTGKFLIFQ
jgi:hypothetical protein